MAMLLDEINPHSRPSDEFEADSGHAPDWFAEPFTEDEFGEYEVEIGDRELVHDCTRNGEQVILVITDVVKLRARGCNEDWFSRYRDICYRAWLTGFLVVHVGFPPDQPLCAGVGVRGEDVELADRWDSITGPDGQKYVVVYPPGEDIQYFSAPGVKVADIPGPTEEQALARCGELEEKLPGITEGWMKRRQSPAPKPNEAIDDPHRLGRLFKRSYIREGDDGFHFWRDEAHVWDGSWRTLSDSDLNGQLTDFVKREYDREHRDALASWSPGDDDQPKCRKVTIRDVAEVRHKLQSPGLSMLASHIEPPCWLNDMMSELAELPANDILVTRNCLVSLSSLAGAFPRTGMLTPSFFSLNSVDYDFIPNAGCPVWKRFLRSIWPKDEDADAIQTLQEFFGLLLTPDTRYHKILSLIGPKRSGKGTIARVLRRLVGERNVATPTLASLADRFGLSSLLGKTLALIAEARLGGRIDGIPVVERLLSISGEDLQDVDRKHRPVLTGVHLPVRFVIMTNELPNFRDASGALAGRMLLLRMTESFYGKEDKTLGDRLAAELPGILLWAAEGLARLRDRGHFIQPESGQELLEDLEDLASPVSAFIEDRCNIGPEFKVEVAELYKAYNSWCDTRKRKVETEELFGRNLRAALPGVSKARPREGEQRITKYVGIELIAEFRSPS